MIRYLFILFQFIFLLIIAGWAIKKSQPVSFTFNDLIITTSTSVLIIGLLVIILATLILQRIVFFFKQTVLKYKIRKERITYEKGYNSFLLGKLPFSGVKFPLDKIRAITIIYPNGGEFVDNPANVNLQWSISDMNLETATINASVASGLGGYYILVDSNIPSDQTSSNVNMSAVEQTLWARVQMDVTDDFGNSSSDKSDGYFILGNPEGELDSEWLSEEENLIVLDWGWQIGQLIVIHRNAITSLEIGDEIQIIDANGIPLRTDDLVYQGDYAPDYTLGFQNSFRYKAFDFGFLLDTRQGGIVVSRTKTIGSTSGQLKETLVGRETGIVADGVVQVSDGFYEPNTTNVDARTYNNRYYERDNVEAAKYDASYTKLREVTLGYTIPKRFIKQLPITNARFSLSGRNLLLWTENPHFDPETVAVSGGTLQPGIENMSYPSTRSFTFNLRVDF